MIDMIRLNTVAESHDPIQLKLLFISFTHKSSGKYISYTTLWTFMEIGWVGRRVGLEC